MTPGLRKRLAAIELLVLDVDGILTDGTLFYGEHGELFKAFHVHDGMGMKMLMLGDVRVAVISAKKSAPLRKRLDDLGVTHRLGREDKSTALDELINELGIGVEVIAYAGDDLIDLPVMRRVALAVTVPNARPQVIAEADWVTTASGGRGAVREMAEALLDARDTLAEVVSAVLAS